MFRRGLDTRAIACTLQLREADAERILHREIEAERKERHAGSTPSNTIMAAKTDP